MTPDKLLKEIKDKRFVSFTKDNSRATLDTLTLLQQYRLVESYGSRGNTWSLSADGLKAEEKGFDNWKYEYDNPKQTTTFNIGENKGFIANHLNFDKSPLTIKQNIYPEKNDQQKISTSLSTSIADISSWIVKNIIQIILSVIATVIGAFICFKMGWI